VAEAVQEEHGVLREALQRSGPPTVYGSSIEVEQERGGENVGAAELSVQGDTQDKPVTKPNHIVYPFAGSSVGKGGVQDTETAGGRGSEERGKKTNVSAQDEEEDTSVLDVEEDWGKIPRQRIEALRKKHLAEISGQVSGSGSPGVSPVEGGGLFLTACFLTGVEISLDGEIDGVAQGRGDGGLAASGEPQASAVAEGGGGHGLGESSLDAQGGGGREGEGQEEGEGDVWKKFELEVEKAVEMTGETQRGIGEWRGTEEGHNRQTEAVVSLSGERSVGGAAEEEEKQEKDAGVISSVCGEGSTVSDEEEEKEKEKEKEVIASSVFVDGSAVPGYMDLRVMKTPAMGDVVAGSAWDVYAELDAKQVRCGIEQLLGGSKGGGRGQGAEGKREEEEGEEERGGEILAAGAELESKEFDPARVSTRVTTQARQVAANEGVLLKVYTHTHTHTCMCACV
jgi:hypothetical protein